MDRAMSTPLFGGDSARNLAASAKPLSAALPAHATPAPLSPWTPQPDAAQRSLAEAKRAAIEAGRADGMRETAELRARLATLIGELERSRSAAADRDAEAIADAAVTVIDAYFGASERTQQLAPLVRGWIARGAGTATARVNPADVAAMRAAIG